MRSIGQLPSEATARTFGDYLVVQGIPNAVEPEDSGSWTVWIHEDDHLARAQQLLDEFRLNPSDPKFRQAAPTARELREKEQKENTAYAKRFHDRSSVWRGGSWRAGWLTSALLAGCVAVALFKFLRGENDPLVRALYITNILSDGLSHSYLPGLLEIRNGQFWRLFTPVFLHFGPLHLLFNMFWLADLGSQIEARQGSGRLALLVGVIAAASNVGQYYYGGPAFGGMSGVVFGLIGYIWLRSKFDPGSGLFIDPTTLVLSLVWFFACITGFVGPIANMAHAAGLGVGLAWGFISAKLSR